jgi:hypothetical protein
MIHAIFLQQESVKHNHLHSIFPPVTYVKIRDNPNALGLCSFRIKCRFICVSSLLKGLFVRSVGLD